MALEGIDLLLSNTEQVIIVSIEFVISITSEGGGENETLGFLEELEETRG